MDEVTWFKSGAFPFLGTYEKGYWADPYTLFWVEVIAMQFAELRRWQVRAGSRLGVRLGWYAVRRSAAGWGRPAQV